MIPQKKHTGDVAEQMVVEHLERDGFRIRDRNISNTFGELDIVAEKGELLCFVEVKARRTAVFGDPSMSVSSAKQGRVVRCAMLYVQQRKLADQRAIRFDVASVVGAGATLSMEYIPDAFDAGF